MTHYVYYHIDPITNQVKYVGKGTGRRAFDFNKRSKIHKKWTNDLLKQGLKPIIEIMYSFNNEKEAVEKESELIKQFREQKIELLNISEKGTVLSGKMNGMFGRKRPDLISKNKSNKGKSYEEIYGKEKAKDLRSLVSKNTAGNKNPMFGRKQEAAPAFGRTGISHPMFGKSHSDESRKKISDSLKMNRGIKIKCSNGIVYNSISQAAKDLQISRNDISKVLKGIIKIYKNYTFQYVSHEDVSTKQS